MTAVASDTSAETHAEVASGEVANGNEVRVVRSTKRRKTAEAHLRDGVLEVRIPARFTKAQEREMVAYFRQRFERRQSTDQLDLPERAARLARTYDLPHPASIRWVSNQAQRWGSCTPTRGSIRLSDRMAGFPDWVVDYVIVHELAHFVELGHTTRFWELVNRYALAERARGFLIAKAWEEREPFAGQPLPSEPRER
ncbi:MAG: M48 family metallopeptidase [Actinomycetota bacterium]|nr:M48 family metallopeptidase [Actinomycetota bacterium]